MRLIYVGIRSILISNSLNASAKELSVGVAAAELIAILANATAQLSQPSRGCSLPTIGREF